MRNTIRQASENTLISKCAEITVYGIVLVCMQRMFYGYITGQNVMVAVCYLAVIAFVKMIWPIELLRRYVWWQLFSVIMCCFFGWWLIYTAENTRAGWYRFNVLKARVEAFVAHAPAYVIMANCEGKITATSDNIALLTGYGPKELIGKPLTLLMREGPAARHQIAYNKAIAMLRDPHSADQGWMLQGLITVAISHKNGNLVPVKAYAGGIRWSTEIQFKGDIDMFAVFVPVQAADAVKGLTNINKSDVDELQIAPVPPVVPTGSLPNPIPNPNPVPQDVGRVIK